MTVLVTVWCWLMCKFITHQHNSISSHQDINKYHHINTSTQCHQLVSIHHTPTNRAITSTHPPASKTSTHVVNTVINTVITHITHINTPTHQHNVIKTMSSTHQTHQHTKHSKTVDNTSTQCHQHIEHINTSDTSSTAKQSSTHQHINIVI
jgi:hypothetical protein